MTFSPKYFKIKLELLSLKKQLQNQKVKLADSKKYGCLKFALHQAKYSKILPVIEKKELFSPRYFKIKLELLSLKKRLQEKKIKLQHSKEYLALKVALYRAKPHVELKNSCFPINVMTKFSCLKKKTNFFACLFYFIFSIFVWF